MRLSDVTDGRLTQTRLGINVCIDMAQVRMQRGGRWCGQNLFQLEAFNLARRAHHTLVQVRGEHSSAHARAGVPNPLTMVTSSPAWYEECSAMLSASFGLPENSARYPPPSDTSATMKSTWNAVFRGLGLAECGTQSSVNLMAPPQLAGRLAAPRAGERSSRHHR